MVSLALSELRIRQLKRLKQSKGLCSLWLFGKSSVSLDHLVETCLANLTFFCLLILRWWKVFLKAWDWL